MVKFGLMALVSSKHENFEVMNFVEKSQEIVTLDEKQKRSLVNFYRKNPTFIDVLSTHVTNFIDKLGINGGLSKDDIEFIETLVNSISPLFFIEGHRRLAKFSFYLKTRSFIWSSKAFFSFEGSKVFRDQITKQCKPP